MDHHTYAKSGSKKWSAAEKRELVVQRIASDEIFSKYSPKHGEPWKRFKEIAKIGDFSEHALRKQWLAMVQRYRIQKASVPSGPLNREIIEEQNKEWEFFGLIHSYMNQKTADLHSYALKEPNVHEPSSNQHKLAIASVYSCDESQLSPLMLGVLNDHSFGEPPTAATPPLKASELELEATAVEEVNKHEAVEYNEIEASSCMGNEELDRLLAEATMPENDTETMACDPIIPKLEEDDVECGPVMIGGEISLSNSCYNNFYPSPNGEITPGSGTGANGRHRHRSPSMRRPMRRMLSEKEKYYKHRRRYEQRMEKRLMGLCTVVGELLQQVAPNLDVQALLALGKDSTLNSASSSDENDEDTKPLMI
ncbi:uncharacterized protein Dwil_GK15536 [Drosophila willistoni]|uniref:Uncharacterized protein n=1 Tax=Drosophila willistoni TaxID=7260 RepID=B4NPB6_DROWI|nr:uncharacterized protein LOC6653117 [Drosophila willistoni]EDW86356.1 uncharacterized protein Dwil_GK15536 [Drosophila willistoni]